MRAPLKVALLLGGPSGERGISLNSARSVADHLEGPDVAIDPIVYFDVACRPYAIDRKMLFSNTPSDFDFKLSRVAQPLGDDELAALLRTADIAFPAMHGAFGEDGGVQRLLERFGVNYVGSAPEACSVAYDKFLAHKALRAAGLRTVPSVLFSSAVPEGAAIDGDREAVDPSAWLVAKPTAGGSSLGVVVFGNGEDASSAEELTERIADAIDRYGSIVVQPFIEGTEFTTVVIDGPNGPVALPPVEVELRNRNGREEIFSFRHKYLPSDDSRYHCPPRQEADVVTAIRSCAEEAFRVLGLRDFARIDCWVDRGKRVIVSDVNPISGMEQNSFLFIQAAEAGMTHADVLRLIVSTACRRYGLRAPREDTGEARQHRRRIPVLFGGQTAERHVSVLSGTNVWLKLMRSERFEPVPYLMESPSTVWELSYSLALRHSVDQIVEACGSAAGKEEQRRALADDVAARLCLEPWQRSVRQHMPRRMTLDGFLAGQSFVFLALHGGIGEDGTMQQELDLRGIAYNGSGPEASRLCMDKFETGLRLRGLESQGIFAPRKIKLPLSDHRLRDEHSLWGSLVELFGRAPVMVKPSADGCSAGVVPLGSPQELRSYVDAVLRGDGRLEKGRFEHLAHDQIVELPMCPTDLLFEEFVPTDDVAVVDAPGDAEPARLQWGEAHDVGWIEVTVGVMGTTRSMKALSPSLAIARKGVLSVEEKFMGGTGINITPPPPPPLGRVRPEALARTKQLIAHVANLLGLRGYGRIDAFMNRDTGEIVVIEANTLPALTPSTVLYHQGLEESPPIHPRELLERIIDLGLQEHGRHSSVAGSVAPASRP